MPGVDILLVPTSLTLIRLEVRESWAPSAPNGCYHVKAYHEQGSLLSEAVAMGSVPDCVEVPEPPFELALTAALIVVVAVVKLRDLLRPGSR